MKDLKDLVRPTIQALAPYSSARDEYSGKEATVFLDANESPYNAPYNRYPDPLQRELKIELAKIKGVRPEATFLGNGSDEAIDLVFRVFCVPGRDNVVAIEPTYGMYAVCAEINDIEYRRVRLDEGYRLNAARLLQACNEYTKVIFICSPNNPTGNLMDRGEMEKILESFQGIVVVDEAYADFAAATPLRLALDKYPNLIVLNTFSKAWASAGIRLGIAFAQPAIIRYFNKVKYPYNVNLLTQEKALEMMRRRFDVEKWVKRILDEREKVMNAFKLLPIFVEMYPTDANFFLVKVVNAQRVYDYLIDEGIVVRNRSKVALCEDCLRITIGTPQENSTLLGALRRYTE